MRLTELEAAFTKRTENGWTEDATFADCDGLWFLCPLCWTRNGGPIGTHGLMCWKPHVPQTVSPTPGRWSQTGSGLHDVSLVGGSSSVWLQGGCGWHGHITNGAAVGGYEGEQALAQVVPLQESIQAAARAPADPVLDERPRQEPTAVPAAPHAWWSRFKTQSR